MYKAITVLFVGLLLTSCSLIHKKNTYNLGIFLQTISGTSMTIALKSNGTVVFKEKFREDDSRNRKYTLKYLMKDNKIIISLKFLNPEIAFIKTISFPSLDCTVHFNAPESEWIKDPLTDYSYILPLKETELEIPCEITEDYVNTDWEISYIIYDDGVPYNDGLRYLYDKEDKTYGTLLAEL